MKAKLQTRNRHLDYLIDPSFQGVNRLFVLLIENDAHGTSYKAIFSSNCRNKRLESYDLWKKIFWSPSKKWLKNIW